MRACARLQLRDDQVGAAHEAAQVLTALILGEATSHLLQRSPLEGHGSRGGGGVYGLLPNKANGGEAQADPMEEAMATVQDYLADVSEWLQEYFFASLARTCLESLVALLVASVLRGTTPFHDPAVAAQKLRRYKQALQDGFGRYSAQLQQAGLADIESPVRRAAVLPTRACPR
jgi:hypothetical protein